MDLNPEFGFLSQMHPFYFIEVSKDEELNKQIFSNWIFKEKIDFASFLKDQLGRGNRLKGLPFGFEFIKYKCSGCNQTIGYYVFMDSKLQNLCFRKEKVNYTD